jgi:hypothetical protein
MLQIHISRLGDWYHFKRFFLPTLPDPSPTHIVSCRSVCLTPCDVPSFPRINLFHTLCISSALYNKFGEPIRLHPGVELSLQQCFF